MKFTSLLALPLIFCASCTLFDPDYAAYKKQQQEQATGAAGGYNAADPYGSPNIPAETGTYTQVGQSGGYDNSSSSTYYGAADDAGTYTASGSGSSSSHTVVKGDTLWGISRKYGVSVNAIKEANGLSGDVIVVGKTLVIPAR